MLGSKMYPKGTNHFSPYSALFKKEQREYICSLVVMKLDRLSRHGNCYLRRWTDWDDVPALPVRSIIRLEGADHVLRYSVYGKQPSAV